MFGPYNRTGTGYQGGNNRIQTIYMCEGRKARPTPMDLRSIPAEVHAFESHPSHYSGAPLYSDQRII